MSWFLDLQAIAETMAEYSPHKDRKAADMNWQPIETAPMDDVDDLFADYPKITPGRITWSQLHAIVDWQERHGIADVTHGTLAACWEEGQSAARAGLELGLIDYGQATGSDDY